MRRALFVDGHDISNPAVLAETAERFSVGAPSPAQRQTVLGDWRTGQARGVEGSPHFFCGSLDAFSPGLDISEHEGQIRVHVTIGALNAFIAACTAPS